MYIGIDIGGTKCAVCTAEYQFGQIELTGRKQVETARYASPEALLETLADLALSFGGDIEAAGVSCGGPLDSKTGVVLSPPNLPGWNHIPVTDILARRLRVPVRIQNDANACALAEWRFGAGRGFNNVIFLTFGTGLGAGLILDGRLYEGTNGMAGEVGHIRLDAFGPVGFGKTGSFEGFCSGGGIAQLGRMRALEQLQCGGRTAFCSDMSELDSITTKKIAQCADAGDPLSREIFALCGRKLGLGLSILTDILNPERIILGSVFVRSRHLLWPEAERVMREEAIASSREAVAVVPAQLGESIGDYAAVAVAVSAKEEEIQ